MSAAASLSSIELDRPGVRIHEPRESFDLARRESLIKRESDRSPVTAELCDLIRCQAVTSSCSTNGFSVAR